LKLEFKNMWMSIFAQILVVFIIVFLSLYVMNMLTNIMATRSIDDEIQKSIEYQANHQLEILESEIRRIMSMQSNCVSQKEFMTLGLYGEDMIFSTKHEYQKMILDKIEFLKNISANVEGVTVILPMEGIVLDTYTKGYSRQPEVFSRTDNGHEAGVIFYRLGELPLRSSLQNVELLYIEIHSAENIIGSGEYHSKELIPAVTIRVDLSLDKIRKNLLSSVDYLEGISFLINENQGWFASNKQVSEIFKDKVIQTVKASESTKGIQETPFEYMGEIFKLTYKNSEFLDTTLVLCIPEKIIRVPLYKYGSWLWIVTLYALGIMVLFSIWLNKRVNKPMNTLINAFQKVAAGSFNVYIMHNANDEFRKLYMHFNRMTKEIKNLITENYEQRIRLQNAQLRQLQYQINPHFLYNSFMMVSNLISLCDYDEAKHITKLLSRYYQKVTQNIKDEHTLESEIDIVRDYMEIQAIRFIGRVSYVIEELPKIAKELLIPCFSIQPIVENSYKHGLTNKMKNGMIKISFLEGSEYLSVFIEDNGDEVDEEKLNEIRKILSDKDSDMRNSGLINVGRRLLIKFGKASGLYVHRGTAGGTCFELKIFIGGRTDV